MKQILLILSFSFLCVSVWGQAGRLQVIESGNGTNVSDSITVVNIDNGGQTVYRENGTTTTDVVGDVLSGTLLPLADNAKTTDTASVPFGFAFTPTINIWRDGQGGFKTDIDNIKAFRDSFLFGGKSYFVDPVGGLNSNSGLTKDEPFKTFSFAISRPDVDVIYLKGAIYPGITSFSTGRDSVSIIGYDGTPVIGNIEAQKTWTTTSMTNVYKTTVLDTLSWPVDLLTIGEMGEYVRLRAVADTSNLDGNPGTYFYESDSLYVHTSDELEPNTYTNFLLVDNPVRGFGSTGKIYIENIDLYGRFGFTSSSTGQYYFRDCSFFYGPSGDLLTFDSAYVILSNVNFGHSYADAIDYDSGITAIEHNCLGRYAGYDFSGADNQLSTGHDGAKIISINCDYGLSSNNVIFDVNANTQRWILGGRFGGKWNSEGAGDFTLGVGNASENTSNMWAEGVKFGSDADFDFSANFGTIYYRNMLINSTTRTDLNNGGKLERY